MERNVVQNIIVGIGHRFVRKPIGHAAEEVQPTGSDQGEQQLSLTHVNYEPRELQRHKLYIQSYELPRAVAETLTDKEKIILDASVKAAEGWASVYNAQVGDGSEGADLYPKGVSKRRIARAAATDPELLDHYSVVRINDFGEFVSVPMHEEYSQIIAEKGVIRELETIAIEAARIGDHFTTMWARLKKQELTTGDHKKGDQARYERDDEPKVELVLGFFDNDLDRLFGEKYAAEGWVDVKDEQLTRLAIEFVEDFTKFSSERSGIEPPKIKPRVGHTVIKVGLAAFQDWTGNSHPCQPEWRKESGSKFTISKPDFEDNLRGKWLPAFKEVIDPDRRVGVGNSLVRVAAFKKLLAHEISHSDIPEDLIGRLGEDVGPAIKELYCDLNGLINYAGVQGIASGSLDKEWEVALGLALAEGILEYKAYQKDNSRVLYYVSTSTIKTYFQREKAIKEEDGRITWGNSRTVLLHLGSLHSQVEFIMRNGTKQQGENFFYENFDADAYKDLSRKRLDRTPFQFSRTVRVADLNTEGPITQSVDDFKSQIVTTNS